MTGQGGMMRPFAMRMIFALMDRDGDGTISLQAAALEGVVIASVRQHLKLPAAMDDRSHRKLTLRAPRCIQSD